MWTLCGKLLEMVKALRFLVLESVGSRCLELCRIFFTPRVKCVFNSFVCWFCR